MMNPANSKSDSSILAIILGSLGVVVFSLCAAYFLHRYPVNISAQIDKEKPARFLIRESGAQVLLLVDTLGIQESWSHAKLEKADFSYGWVSVLQQEFGYFDVRDVGGAESVSLADYRIVVFSSSALQSDKVTANGVSIVTEFVRSGGLAVLDYPSDTILAPFDLKRLEKSDMGQTLSAEKLSLLLGRKLSEETETPIPVSLPVFTDIQTYVSSITGKTESSLKLQDSVGFESVALKSVGFKSVGFEINRLGAGVIVLTKWDFGRWVSLTQQGLPDKNLQTENRYKQFGHSDKLEANDLVADSAYLNANYPWVDIAEKKLGNLVAGLQLAPRWFTAPDSSAGIFMMTHDDEGLGDDGVWMNDYENQRGFSSTTFVMRSDKLSVEGVKKTIDNAGVIGLHWNRFDREDKASLETLGLGRWRPIQRRRSLQSQIDWLDSLGVKTIYNRNHYFLWDEDPYQPFRALEAVGVTMDNSYGPDLHDNGYLFGGAFPFHPLDGNGASFKLTETPVTWTENFASADSVWIERILADNAAQFHGVIVALYHNNTFAWAPDYSVYASWQKSYEFALASGHTMFSASQLGNFLQAREESELTWESDSEGVEVYCQTTMAGLALIVPQVNLYRPTLSTHDAGASENPNAVRIDTVRILDSPHWRIVLPQGKFLLSFERRTNKQGGN